jgi:hypothetical protein
MTTEEPVDAIRSALVVEAVSIIVLEVSVSVRSSVATVPALAGSVMMYVVDALGFNTFTKLVPFEAYIARLASLRNMNF